MFIGTERNRSITLTMFSIWAIWEGGIYDSMDYVNTATLNQDARNLHQFLCPLLPVVHARPILYLYVLTVGADVQLPYMSVFGIAWFPAHRLD
jgi:hypothetical protein